MASTQVPRTRRGPAKKGSPASERSILDFTKPQPVVTIIAGQGKFAQNFIIHTALITHHSSYFKSAFRSSLAEGATQTMKLEDITSEAFGLVNQWLYFLEFPSSPSKASSPENLVEVWMAAERFRMPALQNYASGVLCERLVEPEVWLETVTAEHRRLADDRFDDYLACIKRIYFSTPAGEHKLKLLVLDIFPYHQLSYADRIEEFPIAFCQDVVRRLAEKTRGSGSWPLNRTSRFLVHFSSAFSGADFFVTSLVHGAIRSEGAFHSRYTMTLAEDHLSYIPIEAWRRKLPEHDFIDRGAEV